MLGFVLLVVEFMYITTPVAIGIVRVVKPLKKKNG